MVRATSNRHATITEGKVSNMAKNEHVVGVKTGIMSFDPSQLADIYTNLVDGNYWTAFRKAVNVINSVINPSVGKVSVQSFDSEVQGVDVDCYCCKLEDWVKSQIPGEMNVTAGHHTAAGTEAVDPATILFIISTLIQVIQQFRKRRQEVTVAVEDSNGQTATDTVTVETQGETVGGEENTGGEPTPPPPPPVPPVDPRAKTRGSATRPR